MIQFEKVNIEYLVAVIFLGAALVLGVIFGERELAGNIASGIVGYIGGRGVSNAIAKAAGQAPPPDTALGRIAETACEAQKAIDAVETIQKIAGKKG